MSTKEPCYYCGKNHDPEEHNDNLAFFLLAAFFTACALALVIHYFK